MYGPPVRSLAQKNRVDPIIYTRLWYQNYFPHIFTYYHRFCIDEGFTHSQAVEVIGLYKFALANKNL